MRETIVVDRRIGKEIYPSDEIADERRVHRVVEDFTLQEDRGLKYSVVNDRQGNTVSHSHEVSPTSAPARGDSHFSIYVRESVIGLVVKDVVPGSAGAEADIAPGDIINRVDDLEVYSTE